MSSCRTVRGVRQRGDAERQPLTQPAERADDRRDRDSVFEAAAAPVPDPMVGVSVGATSTLHRRAAVHQHVGRLPPSCT